MFNFEKLGVWNKGVSFAKTIYTLTRAFPETERFGLANQMRRAAVSICSNIAEGSSRSSRTDFARFVEIASGSVCEVIAQATIALGQGYINESQYRELYAAAEEQNKMLSGLRKTLLDQK